MFIFYSKCPFSRTAWRESQIQCPKACRYKNTRPVQSLLFFLALGCGGRLIWIINYSNWRRVMSLVRDLFVTSHSLLMPRRGAHVMQAPPLATIWVYTIVQMDLGPATFSLMLVAAWVYYKDLRIVLN